MNQTIKYNQPIECTAKQYSILMRDFAGICAGQIKDGKYFIKVWLMEYKDQVRTILNS